jgi:hypothetical protein
MLEAAPYLKRLVAGFSARRPGFKPGSSHAGFCGGQSDAGAGFLRVLRFPLPIFTPPISPQSPSPIFRGWYNRPVVAAVTKFPRHKLKKTTKNVYLKLSRGCRLRH